MYNVQNYIKSSNFGYKSELKENGIDYINALATFKDANTIETVDSKGKKQTLQAKNFVIAVGMQIY